MEEPLRSSRRLTLRSITALHAEPDALSPQVTQALLGMEVSLLATHGEWARIRTQDTYEGWCEAVALGELPATWPAPEAEWAEIDELWANLRALPEYRRAAALGATLGARLPSLERRDEGCGWVRLLAPDGRELWTEAARVRLSSVPPRPRTARAILTTARRLLGVPYLWGGCSPLGIDCSGFSQLVLGLHGLPLLRDAHQQAEQGRSAPTPAAADLAFFATGRDPARISHVAIMLDADRFLHAAGSDRVRLNRLSEAPFRDQYLFARRYLSSSDD